LLIFGIGSCLLAWASLDSDPPTWASCAAGMIDVHHQAQLLVEMGVSRTVCPDWP
jgi:hypothetical protein